MTSMDKIGIAFGLLTAFSAPWAAYYMGISDGLKRGRESIWGDFCRWKQIRDQDYAARRSHFDWLVAECQSQLDEAQAGMAVAHVANDRLSGENEALALDHIKVMADNDRLIEENGRLIAKSVGSMRPEDVQKLERNLRLVEAYTRAIDNLLSKVTADSADDDDSDDTDDTDEWDDFDPEVMDHDTCPDCGEDLIDCDCDIDDLEDIDIDDDDLDGLDHEKEGIYL